MKMTQDNTNRRAIFVGALLRALRTALLVGVVIFVLVLIVRLIFPFVAWLLSGLVTATGA